MPLIPRGVTRNVIVLGWVSLLTDVASEMLNPVMPLFVTGVLGASPAILGWIDGISGGLTSALRWYAGVWSDRSRRRKPFVAGGYGISALARPIMSASALVLGWPLFLAGKCIDRTGKAVRTSARDALIADSTALEFRGTAFGFHRAMDTAGAVIGPLVTLAILLIWPNLPLGWLFAVAFFPAIASTLLAATVLQDIPHKPREAHREPLAQPYPRAFWIFLAATALFSIGNSSDAFLILRSRELGLSFVQVTLAYSIYNAVYAATATPLGRASDQIGRKPVILAGWIVYAAVYLGFGFTHNAGAVWPLLLTYGLYQAMTEGVTKALVSDLVQPHQRGGAIGLLAAAAGFGQLVASVLAGVLWNRPAIDVSGLSLHPSFAAGASFALAGAVLMAAVPSGRKETQ